MTQVLTITQLGNPILEQKAAAIDNLLDADCQNLIDSLITTVQAAHGVGIAAPQVARSLRLFIVASHPNPRYPDAPIMQATAMINPRILQVSEEMVKGWEGCLSVPNWLSGILSRASFNTNTIIWKESSFSIALLLRRIYTRRKNTIKSGILLNISDKIAKSAYLFKIS